jgi:crotonobetainyl-CoA:carnitine CoA-transferase CaiB-like acyl-CoA transferase
MESKARTEHAEAAGLTLPEAVTMPRTSHLGARIPEPIHDRLKEIAAYHGRTVSDEVVYALILLDLQVVLAELQHPDTVAELGKKKHGELVAEVKRDLAETMQAVLNPPRMRKADMN